MVLNAPTIPAHEKAELLEWFAGGDGDEDTISFDAVANKLHKQHYQVYRLAIDGELRTRKIFTVKTVVTGESFRAYLAKHGKGGAE